MHEQTHILIQRFFLI